MPWRVARIALCVALGVAVIPGSLFTNILIFGDKSSILFIIGLAAAYAATAGTTIALKDAKMTALVFDFAGFVLGQFFEYNVCL